MSAEYINMLLILGDRLTFALLGKFGSSLVSFHGQLYPQSQYVSKWRPADVGVSLNVRFAFSRVSNRHRLCHIFWEFELY